jgi:NAD(P)-dependent dehydrogenase (short-subunit alcohol dehydrogenase family)
MGQVVAVEDEKLDLQTRDFLEFGEGEVAWITGASSGIGRELATRLISLGVHVFASGRRSEELDRLRRELGENLVPLPLDVAKDEEVAAAVQVIKKNSGNIDMIVPCAGVEKISPFQFTAISAWDTLYRTNVQGAFSVIRHSMPMMRRLSQDGPQQSRIVMVGSVAAIRGWAGQVAYSASKAALLGGMRSLASELAPHGIRVNAVLAGMTETPMQRRLYSKLSVTQQKAITDMHPLGLGKPSDVSNAILFLLSHRSRWITGSELVVDGGLSIS